MSIVDFVLLGVYVFAGSSGSMEDHLVLHMMRLGAVLAVCLGVTIGLATYLWRPAPRDADNRSVILPPAAFDGQGVVSESHPLHDKIDAFMARQDDASGTFEPTGLSREDYLRIVEGQVRAIGQYQNDEGRIIDPLGDERHYTTPCYAHSVAALAAGGDVDGELLESGMRAMDAATSDMAQNTIPSSRGDFHTWPVMLAFGLFEETAARERVAAWRERLAGIDPKTLYKCGPGESNLNVVNLSGEYLRSLQGWTTIEYTEASLAAQRTDFSPLGMYKAYGGPIAYDHFVRYFLTAMLDKGYRGESYEDYRDVLWRGAWTGLFMQSPYGELATGYRSSHHIWNEAELAAICEIYASHYARAGRPAEAGAFKRAARLSLLCVQRWIRPDGSGYIVKNRYPIDTRHGYEKYSAHTMYNMLACSMLATAWQSADDSIRERPAPTDLGGFVVLVPHPFHKVFASTGRCYVEYGSEGDHVYSPTGLIRVHLAGGHPQLGPSDGCGPRFSGPGFELATGPAWLDRDRWHRLAEKSPRNAKIEVLEETPDRVRFRMSCEELSVSNLLEDAAGNGNSAVGQSVFLVEGKQDKAYSFRDRQACVVSQRAVDFARGDFTVAFWFKADEERPLQDVLAAFTDDGHAMVIELQSQTLRFLHRSPPGHEGGTDLRFPLGNGALDRWHHLGAVKRGSEVVLWLDGRVVCLATDPAQLDCPLNVVLGNLWSTKLERHFSGAIDDLRLYRRALSERELAALHQGTPAEPDLERDLVAHWRFDEIVAVREVGLVETITVAPDGVTVEDHLYGDGVQGMRVYFPMLVFDGLEKTKIALQGSSATLKLSERGVRFNVLEPRQVVLERTGTSWRHRNGLVEPLFADVPGHRAVYQITVD